MGFKKTFFADELSKKLCPFDYPAIIMMCAFQAHEFETLRLFIAL
jgi:hypothetical protein